MVQCYREDVEIEDCEELESLYQRICAEAKGWDAELSGNGDNEDAEDYVEYHEVACIVDFPDAFYEMPLPEEDGPYSYTRFIDKQRLYKYNSYA